MASKPMDKELQEEIDKNTEGVKPEYQYLVQEVILHTLERDEDVAIAMLAQYEPVIHELEALDPDYVPLVLGAIKGVYTHNPPLAYWYFRNSPNTLADHATLTPDIFIINSLRETAEAAQLRPLIDLNHHGTQYTIKVQQLAYKNQPPEKPAKNE